jgi:hypothetical protein
MYTKVMNQIKMELGHEHTSTLCYSECKLI